MAAPLIEMPSRHTPKPTAAGQPSEPQELHLLIGELRDENSRSRLREALWISIILHLIAVFGLRELPRFLPQRPLEVKTPQQMIAQRDFTFLEQPPDAQKVTVKPQTDKISDKDRIATSRTPQLDKRALEQLARSGRTGAPGANAQPTPPALSQPQRDALAGLLQQAPPAVRQAEPSRSSSRLEQPRVANRSAFGRVGAVSAGTAIEEAARASRGGGGIGGQYGGGPGVANTSVKSDLEIMSDTMGVDFGPYLQRVLTAVRQNWYNIIPEVARPPLMKQGTVAIEFVIMKDGSLRGMRLAGASGDVSLDRAAWGGITSSHPFPPLPGEFRGEHLALRFRFLYNPDKNDLR